jgi:DNA adenine methylase
MRLVEDPRPLVKWAGGKTRLLGELVPRMPPAFGRYIEPFAGGAALFFSICPERALLGDVNRDLVELYTEVSRDPERVHDLLRILFEQHASDPSGTFYGGRAAWNERRAATFLYLNKTCFNGLFRVNRQGRFNVPVGRPSSKTAACPSLAQLVAAGAALRRASILCCDYVDTLVEAERGDFVYLDPPYLARPRRSTSKSEKSLSSFSTYTQDGFGPGDHEELAGHARALVDRGVLVMASNADVPLARELYASGFEVSEITSSRPISASSEGRVAVGELIFTSYTPPPRGRA